MVSRAVPRVLGGSAAPLIVPSVRTRRLRQPARWASVVPSAAGAGSPPAAHETAASEDREVSEVMRRSLPELLDAAERQNTRWNNLKDRWATAISDTAKHYKHGTVELCRNVRKCTGLLRRSACGHVLSRRERRLLARTCADLFRLVPFSAFVLIPFMELLLPVALKLFPGLLPSTFDDPHRKEAEYRRRLKGQLEYTQFLQDALEEWALRAKEQAACQETRVTAAELAAFVRKVKDPDTPTKPLSDGQVKRVMRLFNGDLGLDKMKRPQLIAMSRFFQAPMLPLGLGSDDSLRIGLRMMLRKLKYDDMEIARCGIDSLRDEEVISACRRRAIRTQGVPVPELRNELADWIALSTRAGVSNSFLLMSRVLPFQAISAIARETSADLGEQQTRRLEAEADRNDSDAALRCEQRALLSEVNAEYRKLDAGSWATTAQQLKELGDGIDDLKGDSEDYKCQETGRTVGRGVALSFVERAVAIRIARLERARKEELERSIEGCSVASAERVLTAETLRELQAMAASTAEPRPAAAAPPSGAEDEEEARRAAAVIEVLDDIEAQHRTREAAASAVDAAQHGAEPSAAAESEDASAAAEHDGVEISDLPSDVLSENASAPGEEGSCRVDLDEGDVPPELVYDCTAPPAEAELAEQEPELVVEPTRAEMSR